MAKVAREVDRELLVSTIRFVEKDGPAGNRSLLHDAVCQKYNNSGPPREITPAIVGLRIKEWGLEVKTPMGRRGRGGMSPEQKAAMLAGRGERKSRKEKFLSDPNIAKGHKLLRRELDARFHPRMDKLEAGSLKAAAALMCITCAVGQPAEVKFCTCIECPLYAFRPYKAKKGEKQVETPETEA